MKPRRPTNKAQKVGKTNLGDDIRIFKDRTFYVGVRGSKKAESK